MAFQITYQPLNRIAGVGPKTVTKETAAEAWALVQGLHASDEKTEIRSPQGYLMDWQELRDLAMRERN